jgi:hypothetical protein
LKDDSLKDKINQIKDLENELTTLRTKCAELKNVKLNSESYSKVELFKRRNMKLR